MSDNLHYIQITSHPKVRYKFVYAEKRLKKKLMTENGCNM